MRIPTLFKSGIFGLDGSFARKSSLRLAHFASFDIKFGMPGFIVNVRFWMCGMPAFTNTSLNIFSPPNTLVMKMHVLFLQIFSILDVSVPVGLYAFIVRAAPINVKSTRWWLADGRNSMWHNKSDDLTTEMSGDNLDLAVSLVFAFSFITPKCAGVLCWFLMVVVFDYWIHHHHKRF